MSQKEYINFRGNCSSYSDNLGLPPFTPTVRDERRRRRPFALPRKVRKACVTSAPSHKHTTPHTHTHATRLPLDTRRDSTEHTHTHINRANSDGCICAQTADDDDDDDAVRMIRAQWAQWQPMVMTAHMGANFSVPACLLLLLLLLLPELLPECRWCRHQSQHIR